MAPPEHSSQVLVSQVNRAFVKQWVRGFPVERPPKALLLVGPSGCGMSTLALLCLKEESTDVITVDGSVYRSRRDLKQTLACALQLPIKRAVLVEEPEGMVADGGLAELVLFVRRRSRIPVVVVCNKHRRPKIGTLLQAAEVVCFSYQPRPVLAQHFGGLPAGASGDLRQIEIGRRLRSERDYHMDPTETTMSLMRGQKADEAVHLFSSDGQAFINAVHENYAGVSKDVGVAAAVCRDLSDADLLGAGGAEDAAYLVGSVTPGLRLRRAPAKLRPDTVWTKEAFVLARSRGLAGVRGYFQAAGTVLDVDSLQAVRARMLEQGRVGEWAAVRAWAPDAPVERLSGLLRLGFDNQSNLLGRIRRSLKRLDDA